MLNTIFGHGFQNGSFVGNTFYYNIDEVLRFKAYVIDGADDGTITAEFSVINLNRGQIDNVVVVCRTPEKITEAAKNYIQAFK